MEMHVSGIRAPHPTCTIRDSVVFKLINKVFQKFRAWSEFHQTYKLCQCVSDVSSHSYKFELNRITGRVDIEIESNITELFLAVIHGPQARHLQNLQI